MSVHKKTQLHLSQLDEDPVEYEELPRLRRNRHKKTIAPDSTSCATISGVQAVHGNAVERMWAAFEASLEEWRASVYKSV